MRNGCDNPERDQAYVGMLVTVNNICSVIDVDAECHAAIKTHIFSNIINLFSTDFIIKCRQSLQTDTISAFKNLYSAIHGVICSGSNKILTQRK